MPKSTAPASLGKTTDNRVKGLSTTPKRSYLQQADVPNASIDDALQMEAIVSVETQSVSAPAPLKILAEMRKRGAVVIHVDAERSSESNSAERASINSYVLIEIGAAMAF